MDEESAHHSSTRLIKHLFLSDLHIPDHNEKALKLLLKFIPDFKPDYVHLVGDMVNFSKASKYEISEEVPDIGEEIDLTREIVFHLSDVARKANKEVEITWYFGNHEKRLQTYIWRNADKLTSITGENGEKLITLQNIFELKKHNIRYVFYEDRKNVNGVSVGHGNKVRIKSGYTGHTMIDTLGRSGITGHTHRLSLVTRNQGGDLKWWMETGCLCNLNPRPRYASSPDWQTGFAVGLFDPTWRVFYPIPILIQKDSLVYNGRIYRI